MILTHTSKYYYMLAEINEFYQKNYSSRPSQLKMKGKLEIYVLYKTYDLLYLLIYFPTITNKNFSFLKLAFIISY